MMTDSKHNSATEDLDPEKLAQSLEIELMQMRAGWQQAKARRGSVRALSFLFLFMIVAAALYAAFVYLSPERMQELRSNTASSSAETRP